MKNVQQLLRQLQTSDHRFHAISALISAASPEKWIGILIKERDPRLPDFVTAFLIIDSGLPVLRNELAIGSRPTFP